MWNLDFVRRLGGVLCFSLLVAWGASPARADSEAAFEKAQWIKPPVFTESSGMPIFRKEFNLKALPEDAVLRMVGLGDYDLLVNGVFASPTGMNQPWSQYEKTLYYRDFDVASLLKEGQNCIGIMLYNSFWDTGVDPKGRYFKKGVHRKADEPLLLRAELILTEASGREGRLGTDTSWQVTTGPVAFSHIYAGEDYDAARFRELEGWSRTGFDVGNWKSSTLAQTPTGTLVKQHWPAIGMFQTFKPREIKEISPGTYLFVFPQNISAQLRFDVSGGQPNSEIKFRCGEHRKGKGSLFGQYVVNMKMTTDGKPFAYRWRSFYLGMQFVEVQGAVPEGVPNPKNLPVLKNMELIHVRAALPTIGSFACSSELFNQTHQLIDRAVRSNMGQVLTDCPHREKLGWLEQTYLLAPSFAYQYDSKAYFSKIARDIRDAQMPDGKVYTVAPSYPRFKNGFSYTVEWGSAAVLLPWEQYRFYGNREALRDNFASMKAFTDYVTAQSENGLARDGGLGDWYDYGHGQKPGPSRFTSVTLSATAMWAMCANAVADVADVLGEKEEAGRYRALHAQIAQNFQRAFMDPETGSLQHNGSPQCANAMALCADVVPADKRPQLLEEMIADLKQRGWQQTPGDVGHVYFIRALAEAGRSDLLFKVYSRKGKGSYGGILKQGLTAMPETWDALMNGRQSLNHCMLGHVQEWFHGYIVGIRPAFDTPGFQQFTIAPEVVGDLTWAKGHYDSPFGRIVCSWKREGDAFSMDISVPPGTTAIVHVPANNKETVQIKSSAVKLLREESGATVYQVPAGKYRFESVLEN